MNRAENAPMPKVDVIDRSAREDRNREAPAIGDL
jgi:hypothetical protein